MAPSRAACKRDFEPRVGQSGKYVIRVPTPDAQVADMTGSTEMMPSSWVVGGLLSLCGAHCKRSGSTVSLALVGFGALEEDGFAAVVEFTAPVFWLFFMLTGIAVFVLRRKAPHATRPFRVPLYALLPAAFVATCACLLWSSLAYARSQDAVHACLYVMAGGVVAWLATRLLQVGRQPG